MKKTLIALIALGGVAMADNMVYSGPETTTNWNDTANWTNTTEGGTHTYAQSGDTITIQNANVTWQGTSAGQKFGDSTVWNIEKATVTLGTAGPNAGRPSTAPSFRGTWNIDADSVVTTCAMFVTGTNNIFGQVYLKNLIDPAASCTINFGESGAITYVEGSANAIEGNDRTITLGAVLTNTAVDQALTETEYSVERRYLIANTTGTGFNPNYWGTLTLAGGTVTSLGGTALTYTTEALTSTVDDFGKYAIGIDGKGIYMDYVKATIPEPATATLSLLALAGLAARRRRH